MMHGKMIECYSNLIRRNVFSDRLYVPGGQTFGLSMTYCTLDVVQQSWTSYRRGRRALTACVCVCLGLCARACLGVCVSACVRIVARGMKTAKVQLSAAPTGTGVRKVQISFPFLLSHVLNREKERDIEREKGPKKRACEFHWLEERSNASEGRAGPARAGSSQN